MAMTVGLGESRGDARQQTRLGGPDRRGAAARRFEDIRTQALGDDLRAYERLRVLMDAACGVNKIVS